MCFQSLTTLIAYGISPLSLKMCVCVSLSVCVCFKGLTTLIAYGISLLLLKSECVCVCVVYVNLQLCYLGFLSFSKQFSCLKKLKESTL